MPVNINEVIILERDQFWINDNNLLHRTDGPALVWSDGSSFWYSNGLLHREDGPAAIWPDGTLEWFLNGKQIIDEEDIKLFPLTEEDIIYMRIKYG